MVDLRVSNSKLTTYRRCPNKFRYKYGMDLRPRAKSVQLERGSWLHELLQTYYDGEDWQAAHKRLTKEFYKLFEEEREDLGDLPTECLRIFKSYLRYYKDDAKRFIVIDSELDEIITLPNGLRFQVIVDLIVEDRRSHKLWGWDHKTRKNFADSDSMLLDPQLTRYFWALEHMGYTPMGGVLYNELRTKPPVVPDILKSGALTKRMNIDTDLYTYMSAIRQHDLDPEDYREILQHIALNQKDRFFRRTMLPKDPPMVKTMMKELVQTSREILTAQREDSFPRTFIPNSCKWDCEYKDLCITELHGGDITPLIRMNFEDKVQRERREKRERRALLKARRDGD